MSDDLISRKALIAELENFCGKQRYLIPENVWELIKTAPTAFDKEKVNEELALHKKIADYKTQAFDEVGDIQNMETQNSVSLALQGAIRIVEKGGIE